MSASSINVPKIHHRNIDQGFLMLEDFGPVCYLDKLNPQSADVLYQKAMHTLLLLQQNTNIQSCFLPEYNYDLLNTELELFRNWFVRQLLDTSLNTEINKMLDNTWQKLINSALAQPRVCVHRDYHSRNLMYTNGDQPGVIDFQDAVVGPITYDLVSLLRDCYISWPDQQVHNWVDDYYQLLINNQQISPDREQFHRWFDLMGIQRHLKAIGIFARLKIRDNKPGYVKDIPRTMNYVTAICARYPELGEFNEFLKQHILPVEHLRRC
jgi:aminoglycoside/choline kinase family phosphotransferase